VVVYTWGSFDFNKFPTRLGGRGSVEVGNISQVLPFIYFDGSP
jgi:hypothetical protein